MKFLFVCTGNTCRSPMAEGLARKLFKNHEFSSAGLFVNPFNSVSANSVQAMIDYGIDISLHKPTQVTVNLSKNYDYIIPMTLSHKMNLVSLGVDQEKILMFKEEISDPYGGDLDVYKFCAKQLKENIIKLIGEFND